MSFNSTELFRGLSFNIKKGEKAVLKGPSGSGKTTLLNLAMGFQKPDKGAIRILGNEIRPGRLADIRAKIAWVPQNPAIIGDEDVRSAIDFPFTFSANKSIRPSYKDIIGAFEAVGLEEKILDEDFSEVSGGENQRIAIVIARLLRKPVIIIDEPTSALDKASAKKVIDYLFSDDSLTVLSASHEDIWVDNCDKVIEI